MSTINFKASLQEAVRTYSILAVNSLCAVFTFYYYLILVGQVEVHRMGEPGLEAEIFFRIGEAFSKMLPKVGGSRWFGVYDASSALLKIWHMRLVVMIYLCVQLGLWNDKKIDGEAMIDLSASTTAFDIEKSRTSDEAKSVGAIRRNR